MACKQEPPGAKPSLAGLLKYQILYQSNATPTAKAANVLHLQWATKVNHPLADLQALITYLDTQWNSTLWGAQSAAWFHIGSTLQSLGGDGLLTSSSENVGGGASGVPFPPQCAVCVTWRSGITALGGRARTYLPSVPQSAVTTPNNAALTSIYALDVESRASTFMNNVNGHLVSGDTATLGVPSYYAKCQLRPAPVFFPFFAVNVHQRLDSQRRRNGKEALFPIS